MQVKACLIAWHSLSLHEALPYYVFAKLQQPYITALFALYIARITRQRRTALTALDCTSLVDCA